jgi:hypothetical protein
VDQADVRDWLDRKIAKLEAQRNEIDKSLDQFKAFRDALDKMPSELLGCVEGEEEPPGPQLQKTHYERIAGFLLDVTETKTVAEIEEGTRIPRTSISAVLYRTHKDRFIPLPDPEGSRMVRWALRDSQLGRMILEPLPGREGQEDDIPF